MGHGKNNRRRGHKKVVRKGSHVLKYRNKNVGNYKLKDQWDHNLTTKQNYEKMGIRENPNDSIVSQKFKVDEDEVAEFFDIPDSDVLKVDRNYNKKMHHMSEDEMSYLRRLMKVYGDDYEKMGRDVKINNMQWTVNKLQRRCARLILLEDK